ncbi:MAG: hypothetical protein HY896_10005 [Deltaproteobacteria bacterium]|nr:hypothetical protein [Deltaproteobacteria bacterium]
MTTGKDMKSMWHSRSGAFSAELRQLYHPKEFQIPTVEWPADLIGAMERLSRGMLDSQSKGIQGVENHSDDAARRDEYRLFAEIGTGLWRLKRRMVHPQTGRPQEEMKRAFRHLESVWDTLVQAGFEIRDHTGDTMPEGGIYGLKVIAFQPAAGISRDVVIETVKPSVFRMNKMIQMGEVIVGTPEITPAPQKAKD